jgi:hypothetical protein
MTSTRDVRFYPESRHRLVNLACLRGTKRAFRHSIESPDQQVELRFAYCKTNAVRARQNRVGPKSNVRARKLLL